MVSKNCIQPVLPIYPFEMPADRLRTESDQWFALNKKNNGGSVNKGEMAAFRRDATTRTGWSTKRLDAWLARITSDKRLRTPATATVERREAILEGDLKGPVAKQAAMMRRVRAYLADKTEGHASASHVNTMHARQPARENQVEEGCGGGPCDPGAQRGTHDGGQGARQGGSREGRVEAGGTGVGEAEGMVYNVMYPHSNPIATDPHTQGNLSGGVRDWLRRGHRGPEGGLRQGDLGGCREADPQGERSEGGKPTLQSVPDLLATFQEATSGAAAWAVQRGGGRQGELAASWGSPSCVEGSGAQAMNKGKEGGAGPHVCSHAGKPSQRFTTTG
jgi:hypothetical protein